jgi:hypothetical protein
MSAQYFVAAQYFLEGKLIKLEKLGEKSRAQELREPLFFK